MTGWRTGIGDQIEAHGLRVRQRGAQAHADHQREAGAHRQQGACGQVGRGGEVRQPQRGQREEVGARLVRMVVWVRG